MLLTSPSRRVCRSRCFTSQALPFFGSSDSPPPVSPKPPKFKPLSDQEWEIRTGRGIYVLQETLPNFFSTGLITCVDKSQLPLIVDGRKNRRTKTIVEGVGNLVIGGNHSKSASQRESEDDISEEDIQGGDVEQIYSSRVQLVYTPQGFERTLHIEGLPLYITSSSFVRHTLNALYSDLTVDLLKVRVLKAPSSANLDTAPSRRSRDKSLCMRIGVSGSARVSGAKSEWEVDCSYTFSPLTGLVLIHTVNSIQPAPHQAIYDAFRLGFGKLSLGFNGAGNGPSGTAPGGACQGLPPK